MNLSLALSKLKGKDLAKLKEWLRQYELSLRMDSFVADNYKDIIHFSPTENEPGNDSILESLNNPAYAHQLGKDIPVAPGQIRRLNLEMTSHPLEIRSVLVLTQWNGDHWLIAPFSPFTTPAMEGELDSGIDYFRYRVVEAWNATVIPDFLLQSQSVFMLDAGEAVRKDACTVFFRKLEGEDLPEELKPRVGPPIKNDLDPRIQYLQDEKEQLKPLRRKAREIEALFMRWEASYKWSGDQGGARSSADRTSSAAVSDRWSRFPAVAACCGSLVGGRIVSDVPRLDMMADTFHLAASPVKGTTILEFQPDDLSCLTLEIILEHSKNRIIVQCYLNNEAEMDVGAIDGIQLRRTSDGNLIGDIILDGAMETKIHMDFSKDSFYFSHSDGTPLQGKWEIKQQ